MELQLFWMCRNYESLPDQGGVLDQDAKTMKVMGFLGYIHSTVQRIRGLEGAEISKLTPEEGELWSWLIKQGLMA